MIPNNDTWSSADPRARLAGFFYVLTFVTGSTALFVRNNVGMAAGLLAGACYVVVTLLFYGIFKPVSRGLSLLAAIISLAGCVVGPLGQFNLIPFNINPLGFFGVYCLLIGYLIVRSTFLPRFLGFLMAFGGLGWLLFLAPSLADRLTPFIYFPGVIGEGVLTTWLLVKGVDLPRWREQGAGASGVR